MNTNTDTNKRSTMIILLLFAYFILLESKKGSGYIVEMHIATGITLMQAKGQQVRYKDRGTNKFLQFKKEN